MKFISARKTSESLVRFGRRYKQNKLAVVGLILVFSIICIAVFAPIITPYTPFQLATGEFFDPPTLQHPMGTDDFGRDVLSQVAYGARTSLMVAGLSILLAFFVGTVIGSIAGYSGGMIDNILMRITEMFIVVPTFFLALFLLALFGSSTWNIIFCIAILNWSHIARLVRVEFLSLKEREFVMASVALGESDKHTIFSEILPNAIQPALVTMTLRLANAILIEAGLSFLGLADPSVVSWGWTINNAKYFLEVAWWMAVFPGIAIMTTTIGINLVGDGLNDLLNPRLKER